MYYIHKALSENAYYFFFVNNPYIPLSFWDSVEMLNIFSHPSASTPIWLSQSLKMDYTSQELMVSHIANISLTTSPIYCLM